MTGAGVQGVSGQSAVHQSPAAACPISPPGQEAAPERKRRSKYGALKVYFDRIWFDSTKEYRRYRELRLMERAGAIKDLVVHPSFPLNASNGVPIGIYTADFRYLENGAEVVEDAKSPPTAKKETFRRNLKIMREQHGIEVKVVF